MPIDRSREKWFPDSEKQFDIVFKNDRGSIERWHIDVKQDMENSQPHQMNNLYCIYQDYGIRQHQKVYNHWGYAQQSVVHEKMEELLQKEEASDDLVALYYKDKLGYKFFTDFWTALLPQYNGDKIAVLNAFFENNGHHDFLRFIETEEGDKWFKEVYPTKYEQIKTIMAESIKEGDRISDDINNVYNNVRGAMKQDKLVDGSSRSKNKKRSKRKNDGSSSKTIKNKRRKIKKSKKSKQSKRNS